MRETIIRQLKKMYYKSAIYKTSFEFVYVDGNVIKI